MNTMERGTPLISVSPSPPPYPSSSLQVHCYYTNHTYPLLGLWQELLICLRFHSSPRWPAVYFLHGRRCDILKIQSEYVTSLAKHPQGFPWLFESRQKSWTRTSKHFVVGPLPASPASSCPTPPFSHPSAILIYFSLPWRCQAMPSAWNAIATANLLWLTTFGFQILAEMLSLRRNVLSSRN